MGYRLRSSIVFRAAGVALCIATCCTVFDPLGARAARTAASPTPSPVPAVIQIQQMPIARAAATVHALFPHVQVRIDQHANALVVYGAPADVESIRTIIAGLDVRNPSQPTLEVIQLRNAKPREIVARVAPLFPGASLTVASKDSVLLKARPLDEAQIKTLIASLDAPAALALPSPPEPVDAIDVKQAQPPALARAVERSVPHVRISVQGSSLLLTGDPQAVTEAKALISQLDVPPYSAPYMQVYRLRNVDATSVGNLIEKTYPGDSVIVDSQLNAISVRARRPDQERIADAIAQLDGLAQSPSTGGIGAQAGAAYGDGNIAVIKLKSAVPGLNDAPSTTAQDIASAVTQALSQLAAGLHVTVPQNSNEIILSGDRSSIRLAETLIDKLDVAPPLVELDTEVLEIDGSLAKNIGLQLPTAVVSTTFEEVQPTPDPYGNPGRIAKLQSITRTPLQLTAELNLLVQHGDGRVLANPRIVTLSGHTANFQAGDTLSILTTTGGGVGTPVTQQLQSFNTGVTLDITPIVTADGSIMVTVHPTVNSLSGDPNGVPEIATRNTQTTVDLRDNQTLIIGGLIQESDTRTISSIPVLGNIPLVGGLFKNNDTNNTSNELVIVVTPHIINQSGATPSPDGMTFASPRALPTLPPDLALPGARPSAMPTLIGPSPVLNTPSGPLTPAPRPTPSAFAASNVFEYGHAPQNNFAQPQDAPQIFYARLQPTVLSSSTQVAVDVVTTTNVSRVAIGTAAGTASTALTQVSPGKWQGTFAASQFGLSPSQPVQQLVLNAYRSDGFSATIQIPVSAR